MTIFVALLPVVLVCCVEYAYGHDAVNLPIGIINKEFQDSLRRCPRSYTNNCILKNEENWASCAIIDVLRDQTYQITEYTDYQKANEDYKNKRIFSFLTFPSNFTKSLAERTIQGSQASMGVLNSGFASTYLDKTEVFLYYQIVRDVTDAVWKTVQNSLLTCVGLVKPRSIKSVFQFEPPIHGSNNIEMIVHFVVGFNIILILFCPMIYAGAMILDEKDQGVIDRVLCCGTTMKELLASHMVLQICMAVVHVIELYIVTFYIFNNPLKGDPYLIFLMLGITAITGITLGTSIGLVTEHLTIAVNIGVTCNFIMSYSSGLLWPIEGADPRIKSVLPYTPTAGTIIASRAISLKGLGLEHSDIVFGIVSTVSWCIGSAVLLGLIVNHWKGPWNSKPLFFFVLFAIIAMAVEMNAEETKSSDMMVNFQKAFADLNHTLSSVYEKLNDETKKNLQVASKKIEETVSAIREKGLELYEGQKTETKKA